MTLERGGWVIAVLLACTARGEALGGSDREDVQPVPAVSLPRDAATGTVTGTVYLSPEADVRLAGVSIHLGDNLCRTMTDEHGGFLCTDMPQGRHRLRATYVLTEADSSLMRTRMHPAPPPTVVRESWLDLKDRNFRVSFAMLNPDPSSPPVTTTPSAPGDPP
jgi:hypothetical protein